MTPASRRSIRGRLLLLTAAVTVPAIVLAAVLILQAHGGERRLTERYLSEAATAISLAVDRQLGQSEQALRALAAAPALRRQDYASFHAQARTLADEHRWVLLVDAQGRQLLDTRLPYGAPLPAQAPSSEFREILRSSGPYLSNLLSSPDGARLFWLGVALPPDDGAAPGGRALVMAMRPSALASLLADHGLPENWVATVLDREGTVVARSRSAERYVGTPAPPPVSAALRVRPAGVIRTRRLDGQDALVGYQLSARTGWAVVLAVPRPLLHASAAQLLTTALIWAAALIGVGVGLAFWFGGTIVAAIDRLTADVDAIGAGRIPEAAPTGARETDRVAAALRHTAAQLQAREDELRRLNQTLEARVQDATATLVQARKLEAIGRLTGGIAHDFNNLLSAVRSNLDVLGFYISDPAMRRFVQAAQRATDRGATLTSQLLAFARKQPLEPEALDVNRVVSDVAELLRGSLGGATQLECELAPGLMAAFADRTQLELVIMNLVINARDAMPDGGTVRIVTGMKTVRNAAASVESPAPGHYVVLSISDTGVGMTAEVRERVFEPFFTTKAFGQGSGLGLPQVLGVVQQLGGGIEIHSQPGVGTTVCVYLKPSLEGAKADKASAAQGSPAHLTGLHVLLVDDDRDVRDATAALLRDLGCVVTPVAGAPQALQQIRRGARFDVALFDYAMPGMNGRQLAEALQQQAPQLPRVMMSGYVDNPQLQLDQTRVLQKPFTRQQLARALAAARGI